MNTSEAPKANGPVGFSQASSPLPASDPFFSGEPITAKSSGINKSRGLLRRLAGRWIQILPLWWLISVSIMFAIYSFVKPTYEASSLLEIEPVRADIFGPLALHNDGNRSLNYLKTQVNVIRSNRVLEPTIENPSVVNLPTTKRFDNPRDDLREELKVEILGDTNLIRIALELRDRSDAVSIVNAVTQAYLEQTVDYNRSANRMETENYEQILAKISSNVGSNKRKLRDLITQRKSVAHSPGTMLNPKAETDPTQPTLNKFTEEQFARLVDKQVECDLEYLDALSLLEAVKAIGQRNSDKMGAPTDARIQELEIAVDKARRKKEALARQFAKIQVVSGETDDDIAESKHLNYQLESLFRWEDQIRKNLEQLKYEASHEKYRVRSIDEASAAVTPASSNALKYMAIAPWAVLFLLLGLFLALEIKAGRKAAELPD